MSRRDARDIGFKLVFSYSFDKEENNDDIDLTEIADNSINDNFEEIINAKTQPNTQSITIDDNTKIDEDILTKSTQKENLPIFKDEDEDEGNSDNNVYEIGDSVVHKKYGRGTIVKIIKYEDRPLLQIEFDLETVGKKLLDPKVADIELEQ